MFHDQLPVRYKLHSRVRNVAVPPSAQHTNFSKDGRRCRPGATQVLSIGTYCTSHYNGYWGNFRYKKREFRAPRCTATDQSRSQRGSKGNGACPCMCPCRSQPDAHAAIAGMPAAPQLARQPPPAPCAARARACGPRGQLRGYRCGSPGGNPPNSEKELRYRSTDAEARPARCL